MSIFNIFKKSLALKVAFFKVYTNAYALIDLGLFYFFFKCSVVFSKKVRYGVLNFLPEKFKTFYFTNNCGQFLNFF